MNKLSPYQTNFQRTIIVGMENGDRFKHRYFFIIEKKVFYYDEIKSVEPTDIGFEIVFNNDEMVRVDPIQLREISYKLDDIMSGHITKWLHS